MLIVSAISGIIRPPHPALVAKALVAFYTTATTTFRTSCEGLGGILNSALVAKALVAFYVPQLLRRPWWHSMSCYVHEQHLVHGAEPSKPLTVVGLSRMVVLVVLPAFHVLTVSYSTEG
jgi:hypothetical protein